MNNIAYKSRVSACIAVIVASVVSAAPPTPKPVFDEVKQAAVVLLANDCTRDAVRDSTAQKVMQNALDHVSPAEYINFYQKGSAWSQKELAAIYRKHPALLWYDAAFDKVLREVKNEKVRPGEVKLWLVYNLGYIIKTPTHCFSIDLHHRRAAELVPMLDFALVTHNHLDHYSLDFLQAMGRAGKKIYSNFYPSNYAYSRAAEREIYLAPTLTLRTFESDHNDRLPGFVMPFEVVCGTGKDVCVIFASGDSRYAEQLNPRSAKVDIYIVHPRNGMDVRNAARKVDPEVVLISHLLELHHNYNKWRMTFADGFVEAEKVRSIGKKAMVPMWGEKIIWRKASGAGK